jgi:hypothetical protein
LQDAEALEVVIRFVVTNLYFFFKIFKARQVGAVSSLKDSDNSYELLLLKAILESLKVDCAVAPMFNLVKGRSVVLLRLSILV